MTQLFDSHCHLQDEGFAADRDSVLRGLEGAGVAGVLDCAYDAASMESAVTGADPARGVWAAVGYHPHEANHVGEAELARVAELAAHPSVAAIGEVGLDSYRGHSSPENQRRALDRQLAIALDAGKPVSVHSRAAEDALFEHLEPYSRASSLPHPGVMHCFGGTVEQARRYAELGFLISVACNITYPNATNLREIAREIPLRSLVVETDSPYLPPQGARGTRNEPGNVRAAVAAIASERGLPFDSVAAATTENARRLLGLPIAMEVGQE